MPEPRDLTPAMDRITSPSPAVAMLLRNAAKARKLNEEATQDQHGGSHGR